MTTKSPFSPLILASASPRRRELLATLGLEFDIIVPNIDETQNPNEAPIAFVERMAQEKAEAVEADGIIIAADTIVVHNAQVLGKPTDVADARRMLRALSGNQNSVITGVCVKSSNREQVFSVETQVFFRPLTDEEIDAYILTGDPMDKAGAYAIQGGAAHMIESIHGSYTNVVGLPLSQLHEALKLF